MQAADQAKYRIGALGERETSWALAVASGARGATDSYGAARAAVNDANTLFSSDLQTLTDAALTKSEKGALDDAVGSYLDLTSLDAHSPAGRASPWRKSQG